MTIHRYGLGFALAISFGCSTALANQTPYAVWVKNGQNDALDWSGSGGVIDGHSHSNGGIKIGGSDNTFLGGLTRVKTLDNGGSGNVFSPAPQKVEKQDWPLEHSLADYKPGGRAAVEAGDQYFNKSSVCNSEGKWDVSVQNAELSSGLYWVPCDVVLSASNLIGQVTVISTGVIEVSGSDQSSFSSFSDGLLFWTNTAEELGIKLSGSDMVLNGYLSAKRGMIEVSGSNLSFECGLYGKKIKVGGSDINVTAQACSVASNTAPIASAQVVETSEDTAVPILLTGLDAEGQALGYTIVTQPSLGVISGAVPNVIYTPNENVSGTDSFSFVVNDGSLDSAAAVIDIAIDAVNDQPVAMAQSVVAAEDNPVAIALDGVDIEGEALEYLIVNVPLNGTLSGDAPNVSYLPNTNYFGDDSFTFQVNDGALTSELATVAITVSPVNDAPQADNIFTSTDEDTLLDISLSGLDVEGDELSFEITTSPLHGTISDDDGSLSYVPDPEYSGADSFEYIANDGALISTPALYTITINAVNDAPTAVSAAYELLEDETVSIALTGLDEDDAELQFEVINDPTHGELSGVAPDYIFTPIANFYGSDEFTFTVSDGVETSTAAIVSLNIEPVNDTPVAGDLDISLNENESIAIVLTVDDPDENDTHTFVVDTAPAHGELSGTAPDLEYSPATDYFGNDQFTYTVTDADGLSSSATVTIEVAGSNDLPVIAAIPDQSITAGSSFSYQVEASDVELGELVYTLLNAPVGMTIDNNGEIQWVTTAVATGIYTVQVQVADEQDGTSETAFSITLINIVPPPSNEGNEFWVMFNNNAVATGVVNNSLFMSSKEDGVVTIEIPGTGFSDSVNVIANEVAVYKFEQAVAATTQPDRNVIEPHGIHVTSTSSIVLHGLNYAYASNDGFLALPVSSLGKAYIVPSYQTQKNQLTWYSHMGIVATEDDTEISVRPTIDMVIREKDGPFRYDYSASFKPAGEVFTFNMNAGETIELDGVSATDLTGTLINATKPISVFSGHQCIQVPTGSTACDHIVEQLPSIESLSDRYITYPLPTRKNGDTFRVLSPSDNNVIRVNGVIHANLSKQEYLELVIDGPAEITSSFPVLLAQYSNSDSFDRHLRDTAPDFADPAMIVVPAVAQGLNEYRINVPTEGFSINYVNIISPDTSLDSITVDGELLGADQFTSIGSSGYSGASVEVAIGSHLFKGDEAFVLTSVGFDYFGSYGYTGGMALPTNKANLQIALLESLPNPVPAGDELCFSAVVSDSAGQAVAYQAVDTQVLGSNGYSKREFTGQDGIAEFCVSGSMAGSSTVSVSASNASISENLIWSEPEGNQAVAPVIIPISSTFVYPGETFSYTVATQNANDDVAITVTNLPDGAVFDSSSNTITWNVPNDADTHDNWALTVSAEANDIVTSEEIVLRVPQLFWRNMSQPVLLGLDSYGFVAGGIRTIKTIQFEADVPSRVRYGIEKFPLGMTQPGGRAGYIASGIAPDIEWRPTVDQIGTHEVTLVLSQNDPDKVVRKTVEVTVRATNSVPVFDPVNPPVAILGQEFIYQLSATDADNDPFRLEGRFTTSNVKSEDYTFDPATGIIRWIPTYTDGATFDAYAHDPFGKGFTRFTVTPRASNAAPEFTLTDPIFVPQGINWQIGNITTDADQDVVSVELLSGPDGLTYVNEQLQWDTSGVAPGDYTLELKATDAALAETTGMFVLTVITNTELSIQAIADQTLPSGNELSIPVLATSATGATFEYNLLSAPAGMQIDTAGVITWIPTADQVGLHTVGAEVTDSYGRTVIESFNVTVTLRINTPPVFESQPLLLAEIGGTYNYAASATDIDADILIYSLTANPDGMTIDADTGEIAWTPTVDHIGDHPVEVQVSDGIANVQQAFTVTVTTDDGAPVITLSNPLDDTKVTNITDVLASITDDSLTAWDVVFHRAGSTDRTVLASGSGAVDIETQIAQIDPTLLRNGIYVLEVSATDAGGNSSTETRYVTVDGNLKVGNFSITFEDLSVPLAGIPIQVLRTYDSRRKASDLDFGYGWSIDYQNVEIQSNRPLGESWETIRVGDFTRCIQQVGPHFIAVTLPDGQVEEFDVVAVPNCNDFVPPDFITVDFEPRVGTTSTLQELNGDFLRFGGDQLFTISGGATYDPQEFLLTSKDGTQYVLDANFGIRSIETTNGQFILYSDSGITHSSGKAVNFTRDSADRITAITDPAGNSINYSYSVEGDLTTVVDRASMATQYSYNSEHGLLDIIDPLNRRISRNIYDDDGRLVAQEDENGKRTEFNHDVEGRVSIVTDRLGRETQLYFDERGNVTSKIDPLGQTFTYTFDLYDNELTEVNALGEITTATYDDRYNQLTLSDPLGSTVSYEYNRFGNDTQITDELGRVYNNAFDQVGNLISITDPEGNLTAKDINAEGLVILTEDSQNHRTAYEFDNEGNRTKKTDASGAVTTYTYDINNNQLSESVSRSNDGVVFIDTTQFAYDERDQVIQITDPLGAITLNEYNPNGFLSAYIDAKGQRTEMEYDIFDRPTKTIYPDGSSITQTYDVEGNKLSDTDRLGRTTNYAYDALNRLIKTTYADGSELVQAYDVAGRMVSITDAHGNTTTYEYDAASRRTAVIDALNNRHSYTYDAVGNLTSETDGNGNKTSYTYNTLDQRIQSTYADASSVAYTVDSLDRRTQQTDEENIATNYSHDELGRLVSVTDALGNATNYTYDEAGNKLTQTDAEGRTTRWTYDSLGQITSRTLPLGQIETYGYDSNSNRTSHTDFNGDSHTFTYDVNDRMERADYADGSYTTYSYDAVGNRTQISIVDDSGTRTWNYNYDSMNRLIAELKPDGSSLSYQYDVVGNKTHLTTNLASGEIATITYTYDALNRLETVTNDTGATSYAYDAVGNHISISYSNGTSQTWDYDNRNRLVTTSLYNASGTLVQSFDYTLNPTGRRTQITELSGRTSNYLYDEIYRLTNEEIFDAVDGNYNASYEYDRVWNRSLSVEAGVATSYSYDANDRLIQKGLISYFHDEKGNTLSEDNQGDITTYTYNSRNRLIEHSKAGVTSRFQYNPDGIRHSKNDVLSSSQYLVDSNRAQAQVLAESVNGALDTIYHYGDDLISQIRGVETRYFHTDGLGSTRVLSDESGAITDTYAYSAFGEVLSRTGSTNNAYTFAGEQYDSALDSFYLRSRYYDQGVGRFTQMDSFMGIASMPASLHKYNYTPSDPVNFVDPSGYFYGLFGLSSRAVTTVARSTGSSRAVGLSRIVGAATATTFAGGRVLSTRLRVELRRCRMSRGEKCNLPNVLVIGSNHRKAMEHIRDAQTGLGSNRKFNKTVTRYKKKKHDRGWRFNTTACGGDKPADKQCDEYPFASHYEGGYKNRTGVSLRWINGDHNMASGGVWGRGVLLGKLKDKEKVLNVPFGPKSYYFLNGVFGF